jgi:23S rRNA (cytidine1920-2'-O)/16S rRNA (cytidine1409-2'-O)-methyltransferase
MAVKKKRLDLFIVEKGLAKSRQRAQALIIGGKVLVNNQLTDKSGTLVLSDDLIVIKGTDIPYVSRGGLKLEAALTENNITVNGRTCLDVGASTGGFTDCLLQNGASIVFAVDVGYGQLAWKLRQDSRVVVIERTNIRHMPSEIITRPIDLVTVDVSFISLKIVIPTIMRFLKKDADILALIKPQFEVGRGKVGKGGVVRDPALHAEVIRDLKTFFTENRLICNSVIPSPILGPKGNQEFIIWLKC